MEGPSNNNSVHTFERHGASLVNKKYVDLTSIVFSQNFCVKWDTRMLHKVCIDSVVSQ